LTAIEYADGSVSGQYIDRFANGNGLHATIDCLSIIGNQAWVSGVVTRGQYTDSDGNVVDISGESFWATVKDNGNNANDVPDQISFSFWGVPFTCADQFDDPDLLNDSPQGQVRVR
jgi:hypothetical protein